MGSQPRSLEAAHKSLAAPMARFLCVGLALVPVLAGTGNKMGGVKPPLEGLLHPGPDPKSPHAEGYEPRTGGGLWDFGAAHAVLLHVLRTAPEGDAREVSRAMEDFSRQHQLGFAFAGLEDEVAAAVQAAAAAAGLELAPGPGDRFFAPSPKQPKDAPLRRLRVLVLGSRLCGFELRVLPQLLRAAAAEVVSVEEDPHLSDTGAQLLSHALGEREDVRHLPLLLGTDTTLTELLETLREAYELPSFDLVVLQGSEGWSQAEQAQDACGSRSCAGGGSGACAGTQRGVCQVRGGAGLKVFHLRGPCIRGSGCSGLRVSRE
ncbi:unnamed protein product [Effrenium voratum]|uniref:Uncharacterized protein n=1 Tax=Effrenium voratum TaxID=2562239 RepID=A0AA36J7Q4_9DINO|nr:unnamed protein product [Effrenium voratum]CAJ1417452.1 unnamed protein product [Effrenium voratum]